ncbi:MAG: ABC transporter ATP-binding protein [Actinobacteria bacterium]|nr:ABC transporter ATP-binding protein [Actinomycetota bacterium]
MYNARGEDLDQKKTVLLENVSKTYQMGEVEVHALKAVDLTIGKGEFVVVLGPSGSGKTTMLNCIGGIDSPTEGTIVVGGKDISKFTEKELTKFRRETVGFIFQFFNLIPTLTAKENVEFALDLVPKEKRVSAVSVLDEVGLGDRSNHFPSQLSGGEQQRVAIARALAKRPPVVLCDEPTGELDYDTGIKILRLMRDISRQEHCNFLVVTHNSAIAQMADRVVRLHSGEISSVESNENPIDPEELLW